MTDYRPGETIPGTQYRYVREIGAGGHGCVYLVEHTFLEARAVMKLLHADLVDRDDIAQRMTREARTLAKLRHPNIVEVRDGGITGEKPGRPYFVMEQLNGMPVRDMLRKMPQGIGVLPALRIVSDILAGLDHAHNAGVVHRDIKPENVFLHRAQPTVTVAKILDFGIAHLLMGQRFTGRYFLGTPRYAAPEQLRGESPTGRTDIYAAGLVLYELLTGQAPFAKLKDLGAIMNAHLNEPLPPASRLALDVPPVVDKLLEAMLAKDPDERPPTAFAAAVAVREVRSRIETEQSTSIHAPEFKTEPSPIDDVLFAASPDDPPIVTEVATPSLGPADTVPDDGTHSEKLRAALAAGEAARADTQEQSVKPRAFVSPARTVPLAAPIKKDEAPKKVVVDRNARTNTGRAAPVVVAPGPHDTIPIGIADAAALAETTPANAPEPAAARPRAAAVSITDHTTSQALVLTPGTDASQEMKGAPSRRRGATFAVKLAAFSVAVGLAAALVTSLAIRASRRTAAAPVAAEAPTPALASSIAPAVATGMAGATAAAARATAATSATATSPSAATSAPATSPSATAASSTANAAAAAKPAAAVVPAAQPSAPASVASSSPAPRAQARPRSTAAAPPATPARPAASDVSPSAIGF
jgi:serine/threonine-protein kinase